MTEVDGGTPSYMEGLRAPGESVLLGDAEKIIVKIDGKSATITDALANEAGVRSLRLEAEQVSKKVKRAQERQVAIIVELNKKNARGSTELEELTGSSKEDTPAGQAFALYRSESKYSDGSTMGYAMDLLADDKWKSVIEREEAIKLKMVSESNNTEYKRRYALAFCAMVTERKSLASAQKMRRGVADRINKKLNTKSSRPFEAIRDRDIELSSEIVLKTKKQLAKQLESPNYETKTLLEEAENTVYNAAAMQEETDYDTNPVGIEFIDLRNATALLLEAGKTNNPTLEPLATLLMRDAVTKYEERIAKMLRRNGKNERQAKNEARRLSNVYSVIIAKNRSK